MTDSSGSEAETRRLDALLDVYLAGTASSVEIAELDDLYRARGGDLRRLQAVKRYWTSGPPKKTADYDRQREALIRRVVTGSPSADGVMNYPSTQPQGILSKGWIATGSRTQTLRRWMWSLGSVATLVGAFFVFRLGSSRTRGDTRSYTTGVNQQGVVTLDDGTRVTLAPQTTLWLSGFSARNRAVAVDGKAYFEVTHVAGAPFEVHSGAITTRVLGTSFLVDHPAHGARVRVAVEEGKVRVFNALRPNADVTVMAGYVGDVTDSSANINAVVDSGSGTEWLRGKLVFYHMPVAAVLQTLSRWYGYQFRCADSTLPQRSVTLGLSVRSSASALATLEQVLSVSLTMTGDTVTLTPQTEQRVKGMPKVQSYDVWTPTREVGRE